LGRPRSRRRRPLPKLLGAGYASAGAGMWVASGTSPRPRPSSRHSFSQAFGPRRRRQVGSAVVPAAAPPVTAVLASLGAVALTTLCSSDWSAVQFSRSPAWAWTLAGGPQHHLSAQTGTGRCGRTVACRAEKDNLAKSVAGYRRDGAPKTPLPRSDLEDWEDYTRYALGLDSRDKTEESINEGREMQRDEMRKFAAFTDRRRTIGIDFGPQFVGLSMSMGGPNTIAMGTLDTGEDWKDTAIKIVQMVSTRRAKDVVIGHPLEKDGTEGEIGALVRHFAQLVADAALLMLGGNTTVYLWDERFSTTYAAMRLTTRPRFDSAAFKSWLDGQRGLNYGAKSLLDAEAARAILEHFLQKDPVTEQLNKERAERVSPSREACRAYLKWKRRPLLRMQRPTEPAGPGLEAFEWEDLHPESQIESEELFEQRMDDYRRVMEGMDRFGDYLHEVREVRERVAKEKADTAYVKSLQDKKPDPYREALKSVAGTDEENAEFDEYRRSGRGGASPFPAESWGS